MKEKHPAFTFEYQLFRFNILLMLKRAGSRSIECRPVSAEVPTVCKQGADPGKNLIALNPNRVRTCKISFGTELLKQQPIQYLIKVCCAPVPDPHGSALSFVGWMRIHEGKNDSPKRKS